MIVFIIRFGKMFNYIHSSISGRTYHGKKEFKTKETATKYDYTTQTATETENSTEEPLTPTEAGNLNATENPWG